jgi:hypothetical protein
MMDYEGLRDMFIMLKVKHTPKMMHSLFLEGLKCESKLKVVEE